MNLEKLDAGIAATYAAVNELRLSASMNCEAPGALNKLLNARLRALKDIVMWMEIAERDLSVMAGIDYAGQLRYTLYVSSRYGSPEVDPTIVSIADSTLDWSSNLPYIARRWRRMQAIADESERAAKLKAPPTRHWIVAYNPKTDMLRKLTAEEIQAALSEAK
jgi:hypothetical protein